MALAGSMLLSHDLGLCKSHCYHTQLKSAVAGRGQRHLLSSGLSFCNSFQRLDSLGFHLTETACRPIRNIPHKFNGVTCHSSLLPVNALGLDNLKTASVEFARSLNTVQSGIIVHRLVPAMGLIIFTVWGLGPLLQQSRKLIFHKSDINWKKSKTHYVLKAYLQPLLLWMGTLLVCRALNPVVLPTEASQAVKQKILHFIGSLSTVLAFAHCLSSVIQRAQKIFMESNGSDDTRKMGFDFAGKAVNSAVWVGAVALVMELLGFSTHEWLTAGGLGTVLVTLAGREILTNFLSSIMVHATRPFIVNDWIQTRIEGYDVSGTVEHVGWWSPTVVRGEDGEAVHIPNHKFTMNVVRNLSQKTHWRIKTHLVISHFDFNKIHNIVPVMRKVLAKNPQVEQQKLHRRVFFENINTENQGLMILVSCFVKTSHYEEYLCVREAILSDLVSVIRRHGARFATPIRTVQKMQRDPDLESTPFADTIFNSGGVASMHPLLLSDRSYRVHGEEKAKPQSRSTRTTGEPDSKSSARPPDSDNKKDAKAVEKLTEDPDAAATAKSASKPISQPNPSVAEPSTSESKASNSIPDGLAQNVSQSNQPKKPSDGKTETSAEKSSVPQAPPPRPAMEENIVLGVALEGSKRTLPIDEETTAPEEAKELAASSRGRSGTATAEKEKKDSQVSSLPDAVPSEQ